MSKRLSQWIASTATINLIKLNGLNDLLIKQALNYIKEKTDLELVKENN